MNGILTYPDTDRRGLSPGDLLSDMVGGLFCEVVLEFLVEGVLELLFGVL